MSRLGVPSSTLRDRGSQYSNGNSDDASGSPFSRSPGHSGRNSPYPPNGNYGAQRFAEDLEGQNDERLDGLTAKVKLLKDVTLAIGNEVRDSTVQLSQMVYSLSPSSLEYARRF
ncbi:hypothetical protein FS837_004095 [Tulasnella sp. UAMH 9824]|nr:hypothetical protein FS837_004095 [Tulasnella sp. UAMH 9824]